MAPIANMPDFTRTIWSNGSIEWQRRINKISLAWIEFEKESVVKYKMRDGFIDSVSPENLISYQFAFFRAGYEVIVLDRIGISEVYSNTPIPPASNGPWEYRVLVKNKSLLLLNTDFSIGSILGYPVCCIKFYDEWWNSKKHIDLTYPAYENTACIKGTEDKHIAPKCNVFLRYLGIRPIFHLPCSFSCLKSIVIASENLHNFEESFKEESKWLKEILSWPLEWSNVNGIVEIKHPLGKIMARGDLYLDKKVIQYEGTKYPAEGELGVTFPYNQKNKFVNELKLMRK